jgi:predicted RNase H-like HicB family nuclease
MSTAPHRFSISFEVDEDGVVIAECIDLPGCHAHGATKDAARQQLREVIALHLEVLAEQGKAVPHVEIETLDIAV